MDRSSLSLASSIATADRYHEQYTKKYRLRIHASNLPKRGGFQRGYPDTYAVVSHSSFVAATPSSSSALNSSFQSLDCSFSDLNNSFSNATHHTRRNSSITVLGQTEIIEKSRSPQWTDTIYIDYQEGTKLYFNVHVFEHDWNNHSNRKSLGTSRFEMSDLLTTFHQTRARRLKNGGCVFCRLEAVVDEQNLAQKVRLHIAGGNLVPIKEKSRIFGGSRKSSVILEISRKTDKLNWTVIHRSKPVTELINPVWEEILLDLSTVCGGNFEEHLRFDISVVSSNGSKKLLGVSESTLKKLLAMAGTTTTTTTTTTTAKVGESEDDSAQLFVQRSATKFEEVGHLKILVAEILYDNPTMPSWRGDGSVSGFVDLTTISPVKPQTSETFKSFIEKGCQIDFCVAIDFTSSNGDPQLEESYHHIGDDSLNDYEETITAIGQALANYSTTQEYCVWGFGAKYGGVVRHLFQCGPTPTVIGVDGILSAYKSVFESDLIMSGPTVFLQVLQKAAAQSKKAHDSMTIDTLRYTVLLVITDGVMNNFDETRQKLDIYSSMPLSVVFVGVGRSDFTALHNLCEPRAVRQTTTCVEFHEHQHDPAALGKAALQNIPIQLCEYMRNRGF